MSEPRRRERIDRSHRLRATRDFERVKRGGRAYRGQCCMVLALETPGEPTKVGIVTSRRAVGGAVMRNRARRRLREIVRRRWLRIPEQGWAVMLIAQRAVLEADHQDLASEVESLLFSAGILAPARLGDVS